MFNNINDNNKDILYNSQFTRENNIVNLAAIRSNVQKYANTVSSNPYVDRTEISSSAIELFQKDCDIKKFNKIAMSDEEGLSHLQRMQELFADGVIGVYEDDVLSDLVTNSKLRDDLGL